MAGGFDAGIGASAWYCRSLAYTRFAYVKVCTKIVIVAFQAVIDGIVDTNTTLRVAGIHGAIVVVIAVLGSAGTVTDIGYAGVIQSAGVAVMA